MASLHYDVDNFSGRNFRNHNNVVEISGNVFSLEIDDYKKTLYLYGEIDIDTCMINQRDVQRWGNGSYIDFYEDEKEYKKTVQRFLNQGYDITNK